MSKLEKEVSDLKIERRKEGISVVERLSISQEIIALENKSTALENKSTALTNEIVELLRAAAGNLHDHL